MQVKREYEAVTGEFQHVLYSPHGSIEGVMLGTGDGLLQLVFPHDADVSVLYHLASGAVIEATGEFVGWSTVKAGGHRVYTVDSIQSVNGKKPIKGKAVKRQPAYRGKIVRLNYARHGEPNGVVLDSGDFIHVKPEGFKRLKLNIGDSVEVDGDGYALDAEQGYVVEATRVNGKSLT